MGKQTPRGRLGWGLRFSVIVLRPFLTLFTRHHWVGEGNLPRGGAVFAVNHISWFDPFVVANVLWDNGIIPRFLAKSSLFDVPFVGGVLRSAEQVPVYRGSAAAAEAVRDAIAAVASGRGVVVYPEGTMTRDPDVWPMRGKTGAARIALATGAPLIPMAQWGAQEIMRPYRRELRLLPRKTMQVRIGPPLDLSDLRGRELDADTLRLATDRLMLAITDLLAEVRGQRPPAVDVRGAA